jgi:CheY-like chemotaxis protein
MKTIALVEDEKDLNNLIRTYLEKEGYNVVLNYNKSLKEAKKEQKIENEMERLKKLYQIQPNTWSEIIQFGKENNLISQSENMLLNLIPSGKYSSDSQSKKIIQTIDRLQEEGMASVL